jgi:PadR family transcriptional regulator, regulatory protein PadR
VIQFFSVAFPKENGSLLWVTNMTPSIKQKTDVQQRTLALMVLKTLDVLGPLHGYGIAKRIEQISGDLLSVNQGTLYPVLLRL